jgi:hypothetical protein
MLCYWIDTANGQIERITVNNIGWINFLTQLSLLFIKDMMADLRVWFKQSKILESYVNLTKIYVFGIDVMQIRVWYILRLLKKI